MHLVTVHFHPGHQCAAAPSAAELAELIRAAAEPGDGLQHVRVRAEPGRLSIAAFVAARSPTAATATVRSLCAHLAGQEPALRGWLLTGE